MEQKANGAFRVLGPLPLCFQSVYPEVFERPEDLRPDLKFPFVENFLIEVRDVWSRHDARTKSGPWVETDEQGKEYALEAIAASWKGNKILMIEILGDAYEERWRFLQMGRENVLMRKYLEAEVRRRTSDIRAREEEIALRLVWAAESRDDGETGSKTALLQMAKDIALGHHEKWDGSGYPSGLAGEEIPLTARIVAIADVFDALVQDRVYKPAISVEEAFAIMRKSGGSHFDPDLLDRFVYLRERFAEIAGERSAPLFDGFRGNPVTG